MSIINICINNVNREYYLEEGSSGIVLENIVKDIESEYKGYITLANINNKYSIVKYVTITTTVTISTYIY